MIKRLLRMNEFNDVRVVLRNDKHIYLENKTRKKLWPDNTAQYYIIIKTQWNGF